MSKILHKNYTDSPVTGDQPIWNLPQINFGGDYRVRRESPQELRLINLTSPVGFPEELVFKSQTIANVYKNTGVEPGFQTPQKRGVNLLAQCNETWTVTDTEDSSYQVALPVSAHLVIRVPANENIAVQDVRELVMRVAASLYETGSASDSRLQAMLREALKPTDI